MNASLLYQITNGVVVACAVLAWAFVIRYSRVRWNATSEGRHLMGFTLIVAVFMTLAAEVRLFGTYPGVQIVGLVLYVILLLLLVQRNRLFSKRQHESHSAPTPPEEKP